MLVLTRKPGEKLLIGDNITVTVLEMNGRRVRLGFDAPKQINITRGELNRAGHNDLDDPELRKKPAEWIADCELDAVSC